MKTILIGLCFWTRLAKLKIHIDDLAILVNGPPQIMLLTVDSDEDFVDEEGIPEASVLPFQPSGV